MENDVLELLDILYRMLTEAMGVPLVADKCIIEREKAIEIINDIKTNLPTELAEAKRLVAAKDEFIGAAKRDAEALRKSAEDKARALVDSQEVVRTAKVRSEEIVSQADKKAEMLKKAAGDYVARIMQDTQDKLSAALETVKSTGSAFSGALSAAEKKNEKAKEPEAPEADLSDDNFAASSPSSMLQQFSFDED